ncbi:MAG: hypothetical protein QXP98_02880 [Thermoproteus sp.]
MIIAETRRGGTRGSSYVYVLIGNELVHVSEVGRLVRRDRDEYVYEVPGDVASYIYIFSFSRQGYFHIARCPPDNYERLSDIRRCVSITDDVINIWSQGIRFRVRSKALKQLIDELFSEFAAMANEIKTYWSSLGGSLSFLGRSVRLVEFFEDPRIYYFSELSIPSDIGRANGVKTLMSLVYENWIAIKVSEALGARGLIRRRWEESPSFINQPITVWFEQGGSMSYAILDTPHGPVTMWVEFQETPEIHVYDIKIVDGSKLIFVRSPGRRAVRPDIVVARGKYDTVGELLKSGGAIDLLIECKVLPYEEWRRDVDEQLIPYMSRFKPRGMILVSRREVPRSVKERLERYGIKLMDNVNLNNKESIEELKKQIQKLIIE